MLSRRLRIRRLRLPACAWLALALCHPATSYATPLPVVDIDFTDVPTGQSPPLSGVGPVALPNDRLVSWNFGTAQAVDGVTGMDHPLQLLATTAVSADFNYSQATAYSVLNTPGPVDTYLFTMNFYLAGFEKRSASLSRSVDEFSILFDLPLTRRLDFTTNGTEGQISYNATPTYVGTFSFDVAHEIMVFVDSGDATWSAWLDGSPLFMDATFLDPGSIDALGTIRIHFTDDATLANVPTVYVDDIRVTHSPAVAEPSPLASSLAAGSLLLSFARRRRG